MTASHHPIRRTLVLLLGLAVLTAGLLLALRGPEADAATTLKLRADAHGALRFNTSRLAAHRGKVTILMTNPKSSGMPHGIAVEGHGVDKDGPIVAPGKTSRLTVTLKKKGSYAFYCPVKGHRQAGMKGTLVVR